MGIDKNHDPTLVVSVRSLNGLTAEIIVFLQHLHSLSKVGGVLEQRTAAQLVQVILPDLLNVF